MAKKHGTTRTVDLSHKFKYLSERGYMILSNEQNITPDEERKLYDGDVVYIDSSWSREINANLVKENIGEKIPNNFMDSESREAIKTLDRVINKNTINQNIRVRRRVSEFWLTEGGRNIKKGDVITERRFTSTSALGDKNYFGRRKVHLTIDIPKGTKAFVTKNKDESEIILPRNTRFKVSDYKVSNDITIIRLRVI